MDKIEGFRIRATKLEDFSQDMLTQFAGTGLSENKINKISQILWKQNQDDKFVSRKEFEALAESEKFDLFTPWSWFSRTNYSDQWENLSSGELKHSAGYLAKNKGFYSFSEGDTVKEISATNLRDMKEYQKQIDEYAARYMNENSKISVLEVTQSTGQKKYFVTHYDPETQTSSITALKADQESDPRNPVQTKNSENLNNLNTYNIRGDLIQSSNSSSFNSNNQSLYFDGKLGWVHQDKEGNCVVLASIIATSNDSKTKEQLEKQITVDPFGNYVVYLPGAKSDKNEGEGDIFSDEVNGGAYVVISKDELRSSFARYDGEVSVLALAVEKYFNQYGKKDDRLVLDSETGAIKKQKFDTTTQGLIPAVHDIPLLLTDQQGTSMNVNSEAWQKLIREKPNNLQVTTSFDLPDDQRVQVGEYSSQILTERHRYAVTAYNAERNTYTIANPWDSTEEFDINAEYFERYASVVISHQIQ